jgi:hypothetical protein
MYTNLTFYFGDLDIFGHRMSKYVQMGNLEVEPPSEEKCVVCIFCKMKPRGPLGDVKATWRFNRQVQRFQFGKSHR